MLPVMIVIVLVNFFVKACDQNWVPIGRSCYLMPEKGRNMTFEMAKKFCAIWRSRLPTFHDYHEYKLFYEKINTWGETWLGYWYDSDRKLITFIGLPSGKFCDLGENELDKSKVSRRKKCVVALNRTNQIRARAQLTPVPTDCNKYYNIACQKLTEPDEDDCQKSATISSTKPIIEKSVMSDPNPEIKTSTMSKAKPRIRTKNMSNAKPGHSNIRTSAMSYAKPSIPTSTMSNSKPEMLTSQNDFALLNLKRSTSRIRELKSTTTSNRKTLDKQNESSSKGQQVILYSIIVICVVGFALVITVIVLVTRYKTKRANAAVGVIPSKFSNKCVSTKTVTSHSETSKVKSLNKSLQQTQAKSLHKSPQQDSFHKSLHKTQQKTAQKSCQKTPQKSSQKTPQIFHNLLLQKTPLKSLSYPDIVASKTPKNQKKYFTSSLFQRKIIDKSRWTIPRSKNTTTSTTRPSDSDTHYETVR